MKKFFLLSLIFLNACTTAQPQVTVTSPPPTAVDTPIPMPTLHPEFIALQTQISASGERFTLNPDGTVQYGADSIPGLRVAPDGIMILTVNGEVITLDPSLAIFDEGKGFSYPGYELNEDGEWVELVSEAMMAAIADLAENGAEPGTYKIEEVKGKIVVYDLDGKEIYKDGQYDLYWLRESLDKGDLLMPTKYNPLPAKLTNNVWNRLPGHPTDAMRREYLFGVLQDQFVTSYVAEFGFDPTRDENGKLRNGLAFLADPKLNAWTFVKDVDFGNGFEQIIIFQRKDGRVDYERVMRVSIFGEVSYFWRDNYDQYGR